jgi:hypothetical protein
LTEQKTEEKSTVKKTKGDTAFLKCPYLPFVSINNVPL